MNALQYFDLDLMPEDPVLGSQSKDSKKKRNRQRLLLTLLMYVFLWLGILGQRLLSLQQTGEPITWESFGRGFPLVALVIATALFPLVFPKVFAKMPARAKKAGGGWVFVQLCVAFQNGFFWQALLSLIAPK